MGDRSELVGGIPLFARLSNAQRDSIERLFFAVTREDGETIVAEGDGGAVNFYVMTAGEAVVTEQGRETNRLHPGDHFGGVALTRHIPRSATVTANGRVEMLAISGWNFEQLLAADPAIREALEEEAVRHVGNAAQEVR